MARGTLASAWTRRGTIGTGIAGIAAMVVSACGAGGDAAAKPATTPAPAAPTKAPAASEPTKAAVAPPASAVKGFANPNLLVSVEWLMQHQADAGLVVVDARPSADYEKGHLVGAVNLPVVETFDPAQPKNLPDTPAKLEALFGSKGIGNESKVVVYDNGKETPAARLFWTLEFAGHGNVAVLDGGLKAWQGANGKVDTAPVTAKPAAFASKLDPAKLPTKQQCTLAIGDPTKVVLDARSPAEFRGEDVRAKFGGHIPGAVNVDWVENFGGGTLLKEPDALKALYAAKGITPDKEVIALCQTGQRSSVSYLTLRLLGYPKVGNYAGSWIEWGNDEATQKAQGA
jgi:thiosulfate/3-mercaptopyruvate sulfurtransferase